MKPAPARVWKARGFWFSRVSDAGILRERIFQTWAEAIDFALYPWA